MSMQKYKISPQLLIGPKICIMAPKKIVETMKEITTVQQMMMANFW